jgi:threonine/homoserine/homoserine lactone efflux protein
MDLFGFALAVLLIELTPGPNMAWLVALAVSEGRRSALAAISGIAAGLTLNAAISVLAASFILRQSDLLARSIALLGAAMMVWLAWEGWRGAGESSTSTMPSETRRRSFLAGFAINLLNPKSTLFLVTVMPQFVPGGQPTYFQALGLGAVSVGIATLVHLALIAAAGPLRPILLDERRAVPVRRLLALAMLGVAAWFVWKAFA